MNVTPVLRIVLPGDVPGIHALVSAIYAEYGFALDLEGVDRLLVDPGRYCRERGGEFWVLADGGEIRGTVGLLLPPDVAELKSLYVHRSIRREGWGGRLTQVAMEFARRAGRGCMILWTDTRFVEAHRFYEVLGFSRTGGIRELHDHFNSREYGFEKMLD